MRCASVLMLLVGASGCMTSSPSKIGGFEVAWNSKSPSFTIHASDGRLLLQTSGAVLESRTTKPSFQEEFGAFLVSETNPEWNEPVSLTQQFGDAHQLTFQIAMTGGHHGSVRFTSPAAGVLSMTLGTDGQNRVRTGFACADSDHFLGFGSMTDAIDHHGHLIPIWTSEPGIGKTDSDLPDPTSDWFLVGTRHQASYPLPTFISNRGFAFLADTSDRVIFDLCQADAQRWSVETWDSSVTLNIYDGPQPAAAVERLTADTGRQPLASDLVLAPWNDAIFGSSNVRKIAGELRAAHIPSGAIWTEDFRGGSFSGDNYQLSREWDVDRSLYPDIEQLAADLHSQGFRFLAYFNTFVDTGTNIINDARAANVLIQQQNGSEYDFLDPFQIPTSMIDLTNTAGVDFVQMWLRKFEAYGFDGWMADYGEWLPADARLRGGEDPVAFHNIYPRVCHAAALGALQSLPDQNTSVSFVRSGTIRDAPNQPVVWGGDQLTTFATDDGFPTALMKGLNLGLAGIAIYGSDIAGYQNDISAPSTKELFFRWTTLGALSTVMRTHHGVKAALDWSFASDADSTSHFARWSQFHAQLWPYLKAAAQEAHDHGMPIMRVLALGWPQDDTVWPMTDEYLFGPSILVAPVLVEGAVSRSVYLPAGNWLPFWSGEPVQGPVQLSVDLPMTEIGLYALAGSIIPMLPGTFDTLMPADPPLVTLDAVRNDRVLKVFGGADGQATDLDGTRYALHSSTTDAVTAVQIGGMTLPSCVEKVLPCADIDATNRVATVMGGSLTAVQFVAGTGTSALTVTGSLAVQEVDFRF